MRTNVREVNETKYAQVKDCGASQRQTLLTVVFKILEKREENVYFMNILRVKVHHLP